MKKKHLTNIEQVEETFADTFALAYVDATKPDDNGNIDLTTEKAKKNIEIMDKAADQLVKLDDAKRKVTKEKREKSQHVMSMIEKGFAIVGSGVIIVLNIGAAMLGKHMIEEEEEENSINQKEKEQKWMFDYMERHGKK